MNCVQLLYREVKATRGLVKCLTSLERFVHNISSFEIENARIFPRKFRQNEWSFYITVPRDVK